MQCESSGALGVPSETKAPAAQKIHLTALQVGVTIAQTRIHTKKIVGFRRLTEGEEAGLGSSTGTEGPRREGERTLFRKGEDRRQIPGGARDRRWEAFRTAPDPPLKARASEWSIG